MNEIASDLTLEGVAGADRAGLITGQKPLLPLRCRAMGPRLGPHATLGRLLDPVVADRCRRIEAQGNIVLGRCGQKTCLRSMLRPDPSVAVSLQLNAYSRT